MGSRKRPQQGKKGNKRMIHGRKARQCARYRAAGRRAANKRRRLERHLKGQPNDAQARAALDGLA